MILEVMGSMGWIALYAGVAGGADCIAIPDCPTTPSDLLKSSAAGNNRHFTIIVCAEGAAPRHGTSKAGERAGDTLPPLSVSMWMRK